MSEPSEPGIPPEASAPDARRLVDPANRIARAAALLAFLAGAGFLLTIAWHLSVAALFGVSADLDAFWIGFAIPKAIADSVHLSILTLVFIVIFNVPEVAGAPKDAWRLARSFLNLVLIANAALILVLIGGAAPLVRWMGPGLDAAHQVQAAQALRWSALLLLPTVFFGAFSGILHAHQRFLPFAVSRSLGLAIQIAILFLLAPYAGADAMVFASLAGAAAMLAACFPSFHRLGLPYRPSIDLGTPGAKAVGQLFAALLAMAILDRLNQVVDRYFASMLGEGQVSVLEYAWRFEIPVSQILGISVALPSFAIMAVKASEKRLDEFRSTLAVGSRLIGLLVIPVVGFLVVLREPVASLWFERGAFSAQSADLVASLIPLLAVIFIVKGFGQMMIFGLLSLHAFRPLLLTLAMEVIANLILKIAFTPIWGLRGVVLASVVSMMVSNLWLWTFLLRSTGGGSLSHIAPSAWKILQVNLCSLVTLEVVSRLWLAAGGSFSGPVGATGLAVLGVLFLAVHLGFCHWFGLIEFERGRLLPRPRLRGAEWDVSS